MDLQRIVDFLARHPREIVTVFLEDYVSKDVLAREFQRVDGLEDLLFRPEGVRERGWPTLGWTRQQNKRLLIFSDKPGRDDLGA